MLPPPTPPPDLTPTLHRVPAARILALRHAVLRADLPASAANFDGDDAATTLHVAALAADGTAVACATYVLQPFGDEPAYRLRGMATDPAWRGCGLGRDLLAFAEQFFAADPIRLRWCNARKIAIGFYAKQGWQIVSDEFDIPTAGPHVRMINRLS